MVIVWQGFSAVAKAFTTVSDRLPAVILSAVYLHARINAKCTQENLNTAQACLVPCQTSVIFAKIFNSFKYLIFTSLL